MSIYEYIPGNKQFERSNASMLSNSPVSGVRVNPMFPHKLMLTPFVCILMIEIESSPKRIEDRKGGELVNGSPRYYLT
jgi:hypothetical protein